MRLLTDRSLAEQMRITPREIERRKELFGITSEDGQCLQKLQLDLEPNLEQIIEEFYDQQTNVAEISLIIGDTETLRRLKSSMRGYIKGIFSGVYDNDYIEGRLRVGKVHKRIGVTPKLYMSAMSMLQEILLRYIDKILAGKSSEKERRALQKILLFDSQLVFETYISSLTSEIEAAKQEVEKYAQGLEERVAERTQQLEQLSKTDPLTGLLNQRALWDNLRREIAVARRNHSTFSILYFDLNNFKDANDRLGHQTGDRILCKVSSAINDSIREIDTACRYGGDEFCIIMPGLDLDNADRVVWRIIRSCGLVENFPITFSFGIVQGGEGELVDAQALMEIADSRMYEAKHEAKLKPGHWLSRGDRIYSIDPTSLPPSPTDTKLKLVSDQSRG